MALARIGIVEHRPGAGAIADPPTILVTNPNSSERIGGQIRDAVAPVDDRVTVITSTEGPPAIESDVDVPAAIAPMRAIARALRPPPMLLPASDPGHENRY